jgi:glycosyltransferase involved in cell wall biosynthesis
MSRQGAEVVLASVTVSGNAYQHHLTEQLRIAGIPCIQLGKPVHAMSIAAVWRYARLLWRFRPHIVHSHCPTATWVNGCVTPLVWPFAKRVCTLHNVDEGFIQTFPAKALKPWNHFHRVICVSLAVGDQTAPAANKSVLYVARDLSAFLETPTNNPQLREELGIDNDETAFLHVGRMDQQKNHMAMIRGFASLPARPKTRLLLVGDGPLRPEIERLIDELGAAERIDLLGIRSDIPRLHAAADIFLLPSLWEGRPVALMEALASGLPCVLSPIKQMTDVADGLSGISYAKGTDAEQIRDALTEAVRRWDRIGWRRATEERKQIAEEMGIAGCVRQHWTSAGYDMEP